MEKGIKKVAIVGGGIMGTQIALLTAASGFEVSLFDKDREAFGRSIQMLEFMLAFFDREPILSFEALKNASEKVTHAESLEAALKEADLAIEAIPEILELKRNLFSEMDKYAPSRTLLATNSSSMPVSKMEDATGRPEKCLNLHFYPPSVIFNMVDIMAGTQTTPETLEMGRSYILGIGCVPLTVKKEILGFCFNRVWRAVKREVLHMWAEGYVDHRDIDRAWMIFTGNQFGPFAMMDGSGLDVIKDVEMEYYRDSKDPKDHPPQAFLEKLDNNELGLKTGRGFYTYPDPEYGRPEFLKGK
ncbi:MAG: hypothetical protein JRH15_21930 [Deltaproteobacteria bacterium]|nr:hypothetical protein [Deltaproteobacteria bacterium]